MQFTHSVAVIAYLFHNDKFLLLKRATPPMIWAPPGGKLNPLEEPESGLKREIREETGLEISILIPANTWFGEWNGIPFLSIDYIATTSENNVQLSHEHSDFRWVSLDDLKNGQPIRLNPLLGVTIEHFTFAYKLYNVLTKHQDGLFTSM
ncbi:MAG: hypothetical protein Kow00108_21010 [Calditrichia bacterium]